MENDTTNLAAAAGKTPLVRLTRLVPDDCAEVWLKIEGGNPTGSYKDCMAVSVLTKAVLLIRDTPPVGIYVLHMFCIMGSRLWGSRLHRACVV